MINKFTRHLGQKYRGDHRPRTRPNSLQTCSTSLRMVILSIPRMFVSPHTGYWAGPFPSHSWNIGQNWPTHKLFYIFLQATKLVKYFYIDLSFKFILSNQIICLKILCNQMGDQWINDYFITYIKKYKKS